MSDTRVLLDRISSFRQRLERTPNLIPVGAPVEDPNAVHEQVATALAQNPDWLGRTLRTLSGSVEEGPLPATLTARARRLLEDARDLIDCQRTVAGDALLSGLALAATTPGVEPDPVVPYHRETVALTEAALRMMQALPSSTDVQLRMCEGVEAMMTAVRSRLAVLNRALESRRTDLDRIDGLARRLADLGSGRAVDLSWFVELGQALLDEARSAAPLRFLSVDPVSTCGYPGGPAVPAPARFVAAHALTVAQVAARVVPSDFEWAPRPMVPVVAALLMDLGMLRVPAAVLATAGPLTADDRRLIDAHPAAGAEMIRNLFPDAPLIAEAVAAHHERPDGTGYPNVLGGDEIPSLARLLAVCDHYAALAADRPFRSARDPRTALTDTLLAAEQGRLDRDFSEYLLTLSFHPVGTVVELTDGRVGVVAANHAARVNLRTASRPVVAVLTDSQQAVLPRAEVVDLAAADRGGVARVLSAAERRKVLAREYPDLCG
jgi:hypothetical protein